ncbi:MAG: hypothetical protein OXI54_13675 [Chloroflexota bacterium]|nr:hypothetical protein [Chloroflexota bacterium]MDE2685179.1 hypothetical protein [Chloroflexota bacterium]
MQLLTALLRRLVVRQQTTEGALHVDTEQTRRQRELARSENQAGHNLTVQTTIDMARTQTWTGGG